MSTLELNVLKFRKEHNSYVWDMWLTTVDVYLNLTKKDKRKKLNIISDRISCQIMCPSKCI